MIFVYNIDEQCRQAVLLLPYSQEVGRSTLFSPSSLKASEVCNRMAGLPIINGSLPLKLTELNL
jgi:hypothetical protein